MVIFSSKDMLTYRKFCHVIYLQGWCEISKIADEVKLKQSYEWGKKELALNVWNYHGSYILKFEWNLWKDIRLSTL
jgi:hypothetical protein